MSDTARAISPLVGNEEVGGGGGLLHLEGLGDINAQLSAGGGDLLGVQVVPEGGEEPHVHPQKAHVVGNVAPHAPQADAHPAGIGVLGHQFVGGAAADVHIHPADDHGVGGGVDDVALAHDISFFHQIGDMHGHRGPGDARLVRQLLLGDEGILLDPSEQLPFPLGHGAHS